MEMRPFRGKDGRWRVDWRNEESQHLGQHALALPAEATEAAAVNAAWNLWHREKAAAEARSAQLQLGLSAEKTFAQALEGCLARRLAREKEAREAGRIPEASGDYVDAYFRWVKRELGRHRLSAFLPDKEGRSHLLEDYVAELASRYSPVTRANRLSVVGQVLRHAWAAGWIGAAPCMPEPALPGERMREPKWRWLAERDFRVLYDRLWEDHDRPGHGLRSLSILVNGQRRSLKDRALRLDYIARRKLYLSWSYYTGGHNIDADGLNDKSLAAHAPRFFRVNTKSAVCVPDQWLDAPEPLFLDVQAEIRRLGRFWHEGEAIAGGRWTTVSRVLNHEAERLNLPRPLNLRVFRRSVVYHLALLGWQAQQIADYLGHVDTKMVLNVYRRIPDKCAPAKLEWTAVNMAAWTPSGISARAPVYDFEDARRPRHEGAPALSVVK